MPLGVSSHFLSWGQEVQRFKVWGFKGCCLAEFPGWLRESWMQKKGWGLRVKVLGRVLAADRTAAP